MWLRPVFVKSRYALCLLFGLSTPLLAQQAQFTVTEEVLSPQLQPFTATIGAFGNGHQLSGEGGSFEPRVFRTMLQATQESATQVIAPAKILSNWDSWQSGVLDGAEVEVLRIVDGAFRSVRRDRVAQGGHQSNIWRPVTPDGKMVPADQTSFEFTWASFNRPGVPYYFSVRAVDTRGRLSEVSQAVRVMAPERFPRKRPKVQNSLVETEVAEQAGRLAAPEGVTGVLSDRQTAQISWSAVRGAQGYVVSRSDVPPSEHLGVYLSLEGQGPSILAGDLILLRKTFYEMDRRELLSHRTWSAAVKGFRRGLPPWPDATSAEWSLRAHAPDTPIPDPGQTYLRAALEAGETMSLGGWNHSGLAQDWYPVLEPGRRYRFDVWMRSGTGGAAVFEMVGFYESGASRVSPTRFDVTPDWQRFTGTFEVPEVQPDGGAGKTQLRLIGPGQFDVDNLRVYRDDAPFLAFLEDDIARLEASGMGALRTHGFIKTGQGSYDLEELTNPGGVSNIKGGNTLPQTLHEIARVQMDPWLQVEPHFSRAEWLGLAEYLAAPFDPDTDSAEALPWAAKRAAQGHKPWVDRFGKLYFEIGNETWNRLFRPWVFPDMQDAATGTKYKPGAVYGLYHEYVLDILRTSPHWPALAPKLAPVLGGWARRDYGFDAAAVSPNTQYLTHADYNGGWDEQAGPAAPTSGGFSTILNNTLRKSIPRAERHLAQRAALEAGQLKLGTYEAGPGYAMSGLNNRRVSEEEAADQERAMKSVAAGTATLDAFLARSARGQSLQNYFTYGSGRRWTSHARWNKGGQTYPAWDLLALFNRTSLGDMLAVQTHHVPRIDLPETRRDVAVPDAPLIAVYATRQEHRLSVIVVSRQVPGASLPEGQTTSVRVDLPIASAAGLTVYRQTGTLASHNVEGVQSQISGQVRSVPDTLPRIDIPDLPPGQTVVYVFEGVR